VVTWVDSSCPSWKALRALHAVDQPSYFFPPAECPDIEVDLCLSLLVKNLPWLRCVWLVTMRPQRPRCLERSEFKGKVRVVHHDEIFELAEGLPSFNSHAIEANLWRIPDLAEKFVYLNDDMYVLRHLTESVFFRADTPIAWCSKAPPRSWAERDTAYHRAWSNLQALLPGTRLLHHFPCALTKSSLRITSLRLSDRWSQTCRVCVRSTHDIPPIGATVNLGVAEGRYDRGALPKSLMREAILKPSTVQGLLRRDLCFLCVNRQPFDRTRVFCDALRACFSTMVREAEVDEPRC